MLVLAVLDVIRLPLLKAGQQRVYDEYTIREICIIYSFEVFQTCKNLEQNLRQVTDDTVNVKNIISFPLTFSKNESFIKQTRHKSLLSFALCY